MAEKWLPITVEVTGAGAYTTPPGKQTGAYVPPASPTYVPKIVYDRTDITSLVMYADAVFTSNVNGLPGDCRFRVRDDSHALKFKVGRPLTLTINGVREWTGFVSRVQRDMAFPDGPASQPRFITIEGVDINILFRKRVTFKKSNPKDVSGITYRYTGTPTKDTTAIADLVRTHLDLSGDGLDTTTKVTNVANINVNQSANPFTGGWTWEDAMNSINTLPAAVFYINPDRQLVWADVDTASAPFGLSDTPNNSTTYGYRNVEILYDATAIANDYLAWGSGYGSSKMVFKRLTDSGSVSSHGLWQETVLKSDIYRQSTIDRVADAYVNGSPSSKRGHKNDKIGVTCTIFRQGIQAGMGINFACNAWSFSDVLPVRQVRITFPTPVNPQYDLALSHEIDAIWSFYDVYKIQIPTLTFGGTYSGDDPWLTTWKTRALTYANGIINAYPTGYDQPGYDDSTWSDAILASNSGWTIISGALPIVDPLVYSTYTNGANWVGRATFSLSTIPSSASLTITADESATFKLNGNTIGAATSWTSPTTLSVPTSYFVAGVNCLSFDATNGVAAIPTWSFNPTMVQALLEGDGAVLVATGVGNQFGSDDFSRTVADGWGAGGLGAWTTLLPIGVTTNSLYVDGALGAVVLGNADLNVNTNWAGARLNKNLAWASDVTGLTRLLLAADTRWYIEFLSSDNQYGYSISLGRSWLVGAASDFVLDVNTGAYGAVSQQSIPLTRSTGWVNVRWVRQGQTIQAKVWMDGDTEPDWMLTSSAMPADAPPLNGYGSMSFWSPTNNTAYVDFVELFPSNMAVDVAVTPGDATSAYGGKSGPLLSLGTSYTPGTTRVWRNGLAQRLGPDYTESSPEGGSITFTTALVASDVVQVSFVAAQ